MARNSNRSAPSDAGDPGQRDNVQDAAHNGSDGTIPVGGASVADRDNVDSERLINEANEGAKVEGANLEPRSEADFGDSGEKKTLKTKGAYMIQDPTTGVEITQEAREVSMSAFLQSKIDDGLIEEA